MISYENLRVLVTGGAGFIGSNLVDTLLKNKALFVRVLDNLSNGKKENLENAFKFNNFEFIEGDFRDFETCQKCVKNIDIIFHEGALVSVPISMDIPSQNNDININGTLNLLKAASDAGIKRFVYASSASVYGSNMKTPKVETMKRDYQSPYALSKGVCEDYANIFHNKEELGKGISCVGLRYFNVYGPRQDPQSPYSGVLSIFADKISRNEKISIFGDGEQRRDFVHVMDVVQANLLAGKYIYPKNNSKALVFNVGSGKSSSILNIVNSIEKLTNKTAITEFKPPRQGDVKDSSSDISKIRKILRYEPKYRLEKGLKTIL